MNLLCRLGIHKFKYYTKTVDCLSLFGNSIKVNIPIRECQRKNCNVIEHHLMPTMNSNAYNWKPYKLKD